MALVNEVLSKLNSGLLEQKCTLAQPTDAFESVSELGEHLGRALIEDNRLNAAAGMRGKHYTKYVNVTPYGKDVGVRNEGPDLAVYGSVIKYPASNSAFNGYFVALHPGRADPESDSLPEPICAAFCMSATKDRVLLKGVPADAVTALRQAAGSPKGVDVVPTHRVQFQENDLDAFQMFGAMQENPPILQYLLQPSRPQGGGALTASVAHPTDVFNAEQADAVRMVGEHAAGGIVAIQGPPGTGKSHVIARGLLAPSMNQLLGRTLVVCNSNAGLDSVLKKLDEAYTDAQSWACRIGHDEKVNELLKKYYKGDVETDVSGFRVVFTVAYQAGRLKGKKVEGVAQILPPRQFETVIYDEASRASDGDLAKVVFSNRTSLKLLVLVGDQEQLPPIVHVAMQDADYGRSCMERVLKVRSANPTHIMLKEQHRMAPDISAIVSRLSYQGQLRCGPSVRGPDPNGALAGKALIGINLQPPFAEEDSFVGSSRSFVNAPEARAAHCVWQWLEGHGSALGVGSLRMAEQCAIITNHIEQRAQLQSLIAQVPKDQLATPGKSGGAKHSPETKMLLDAVDTVDSYQGSERDVVILSPLSTRRAADRRLLNVGISRAKRLVVIVGALDSLAAQHAQLWGPLMQHVRTHGMKLDVSQPDMADLKGQLQDIVHESSSQDTVGSSQATAAAGSSQGAGSSDQHASPVRNVRQRTE